MWSCGWSCRWFNIPYFGAGMSPHAILGIRPSLFSGPAHWCGSSCRSVRPSFIGWCWLHGSYLLLAAHGCAWAAGLSVPLVGWCGCLHSTRSHGCAWAAGHTWWRRQHQQTNIQPICVEVMSSSRTSSSRWHIQPGGRGGILSCVCACAYLLSRLVTTTWLLEDVPLLRSVTPSIPLLYCRAMNCYHVC